MTVTRLVALLSVLALLASLPLSVALAQGQPPFRVVGTAELDGMMAEEGTMVVAMIDGEKAGTGMVDAMGMFQVDVEGDVGAMVMFSLEMMMGEGEDAEMMMYSAGSMEEVMVGMRGDLVRADLMAYTSEQIKPTPTKTAAQEMEAMRGPRGATGSQGPQGEPGPQGEQGPPGEDGHDGHDGHDGADGADGARGPAGAAGADGADGADGEDGAQGAKGDAGPAGPAGPPGADGATGPQGESGGGVLAIVALIIAIVGVVAAGGAFIAGRQGS